MDRDYISELPDSLLTQILLELRTKDSVKTSVLSKRWRNLWLNVPGLELFTLQFTYPHREEILVRFMDRYMEFKCRSRLKKFMITYVDCKGYRDRLMELIGTLVDHGLEHLYVFMHTCNRDDFTHQNIYKSNTLVSLKLHNVELKNSDFVVSLPCLKILKLENICHGEDGPLVVEKLISGCPVLEDLELIRPFDILTHKVLLLLRVSSQTLKSFTLHFAIYKDRTDFSVEIDAPRLKYMSVEQSQSDSIVVKNLSSLFSIDIGTKFNPLRHEDLRMRNIFYDFLTGISSVKHMVICLWSLQRFSPYSKPGLIPKFQNLYHLKAQMWSSSTHLLEAFLESCPNLKNLILEYNVELDREQMDFTNVPQCLISTLEYVEIKEPNEKSTIKLVNYFLENSAVLKKLTLRFSYSSSIYLKSYKKLLTSTKLSPTCQVIFGC
ncbi:F-box domain [Arabidopsis suecica]|uniref:F-box domain n=1 Tax=Arabidopsis suecica TaxID=45249 RepID=A0A8T2DRJ5_ARASU|nr:F-box domain [Arabidopsis suecica]